LGSHPHAAFRTFIGDGTRTTLLELDDQIRDELLEGLDLKSVEEINSDHIYDLYDLMGDLVSGRAAVVVTEDTA
jgi:hypothetical protein